MLRGKIYIYLLISCHLIAACSSVEGTYAANHLTGYDTLKIFSNNKYERIYFTPDKSHSYADTGTWKTSNGRIEFYNWIDRSGTNHFYGKGPIVFGTDVKKSFFSSEVKLPVNYDLEYDYIKL